ncbi:hypothetical protein DUNSADRAFT_4140 [Dunaliella salina]|uniref:Encoded protein n=1 Tax=Dunaliella salina TaxID=3046 RepID=A0ABQ7FV45_DUNSA|nr:hypothetical protein DUNSADRAFT_4140 [Dunaliella salina]|eukprot:KAF5826208.1 hypothetical protein DUNSADRAFT_4140 [Dunaliella salina]
MGLCCLRVCGQVGHYSLTVCGKVDLCLRKWAIASCPLPLLSERVYGHVNLCCLRVYGQVGPCLCKYGPLLFGKLRDRLQAPGSAFWQHRLLLKSDYMECAKCLCITLSLV